ncbi:MAG: SUMF1/EgtB/PvdO family nonheme iron enzyme [Rhodospirillales bacterium]|nr:SUMF1/EgtB/PvdO family nonheme iron enzyme [Rhodospirillales bacterium]MDH3916794.1 SUMF1/EgtB/PvdO family nonheme iron enzyme [Rhodospirillales bacterium]MDH3966737.1 SUMF1/EgtB/PvdO family nonheme iron enzyme [Rhodospirillales bacterium]
MSKRFLAIWRVAGTLVLLLACAGPASAQAIDFGEYHALLIANEKYRHWKPLKTPHEDVADLEKILRERYGFKTKVIKDATRNDIVDELEALKRRLTERDNLLIYYAGHGKIRQDGGYWIGVDASKESRSRWLHYVTISDLLDVEAGMKARHVLVIADSCYSGAALRDEGVSSQMRANEARVDWLRRTIQTRARTILTAGGTEPVLDRVGTGRNSIFARELLARLRNNVDVMEGQALHGSIKEDVHSRARRILGSDAQVPEYGRIPGTGHDGGDFLFRPGNIRITAVSPDTTRGQEFGIRGSEREEEVVVVTPPRPAAPRLLRPLVGTYPEAYETGQTFKDCPVCPEMVVIPSGSFMMGSPKNEPDKDERLDTNEEPRHRVTMGYKFALSRYEVSFEQWDTCVKEGACPSIADEGWGRGKRPVMNVSWWEVQKYVAWLSQKTGKIYRLPSEAEWEYAARAGTQTSRFWGDDSIRACKYANVNDLSSAYRYVPSDPHQCRDGYPYTAPVGSFVPNKFGLYDMLGNVSEWVEDTYHSSYIGAPNDGVAWEGSFGAVWRGGAWNSVPSVARSASRGRDDAIGKSFKYNSIGFRVARTLP